MTTLLAGLVSISLLVATPEAAAATSTSAAPLTTATEWRAAIATAFGQAASSDPAMVESGAKRLLDLYAQLQANTSLGPVLRENFATQIRTRLGRLSKTLRGVEPVAEASVGVAAPADKPRLGKKAPATVAASKPILAQRGQPGFGAGAAAATAAPDDYGPQLAELIEATISPGSWESQGGQGVIRYFGPHRVMVIRQTTEVHEELEDLVRQLRRN